MAGNACLCLHIQHSMDIFAEQILIGLYET